MIDNDIRVRNEFYIASVYNGVDIVWQIIKPILCIQDAWRWNFKGFE
jgi:hypothetical protein